MTIGLPAAREQLMPRRKGRGGFRACHPRLSLLNCGQHPFTEIQAFSLPDAPVEGISELMHLNGELV
jgi:hypothetical protein